jgi:hypothetical protein
MLKNNFVLTFGLLLALLIVPNLSIASYYAQDYDPSYLPYNFQDAVNTNYSGCNTVLDQYDSGYWELDDKFKALRTGTAYDGPVWVPMGSQSAFNLDQLSTFTEEEIRLCIVDYRGYQEKQAKEAEEKAEKEAEKKALAERQEAIQKAITECDSEFFENMTSSEKRETLNEREACKNKSVSVSTPVETPVPTPVAVPNVQNAPSYTPPVTTTYIAPTNNQTEQDKTNDVITPTSATDTTTVTSDIVETSQEEQFNKTEQVNKQPEVQPEQKPSIFKRVVNFLFGWLW